MLRENATCGDGLVSLAFWFWLLTIARFAFALVFFRDNPAAATGLGSALTAVFAYRIVFWTVRTETKVEKASWPPIAKWIGLYVVWCAISLIWTRSASLLSAAGYWATMTLDLFVVGAILKWGETEAVVLASLKGIVAGCASIAVVALLFTSTDSEGRLGDVTACAYIQPR